MKILPIEKIREADAYTIKYEPIEDIDLMERAANELYEWITAGADEDKIFKIFCGLGNNGGDGFALGRLLAKSGFKVEIYVVRYSDKMSLSCQINYDRAKAILSINIIELTDKDNLPEIATDDIVVDAIFGSGLSRPVEGFIASVIDTINDSNAVVISIDTPSGFFCHTTNADNKGSIIKADYTLTFQFPKFGFLFPENDQYVGTWEVLNIQLHPDFITNVKVENFYLSPGNCKSFLKPRNKFSHKGTFGHGLLISGSYGKMGAAVLAAKAGLKAGAGLITCHIPSKGYNIIQTAVPSAMVSIDKDEEVFSWASDLDQYNALAIGPGLGTDTKLSINPSIILAINLHQNPA